MPTIQQLVRKGRKELVEKSKSPGVTCFGWGIQYSVIPAFMGSGSGYFFSCALMVEQTIAISERLKMKFVFMANSFYL